MIHYSHILQTGIQSLLAVACGWACGRWSILDPDPTVAHINTFVLKFCIPCLQVWLLAIKTDMREPGNWGALFAILFWSMGLQVLLAIHQLLKRDHLNYAQLGVDSLILTTNNTGILGPIVLHAAVGPEFAHLGMLATVVLYFQQLPSAQLLFQLHRQAAQAASPAPSSTASTIVPPVEHTRTTSTALDCSPRAVERAQPVALERAPARAPLERTQASRFAAEDWQEQQSLLGDFKASSTPKQASPRQAHPQPATAKQAGTTGAPAASDAGDRPVRSSFEKQDGGLFSISSFSSWDIQTMHAAATTGGLSRSNSGKLGAVLEDPAPPPLGMIVSPFALSANTVSFEIEESNEPASPVFFGSSSQALPPQPEPREQQQEQGVQQLLMQQPQPQVQPHAQTQTQTQSQAQSQAQPQVHQSLKPPRRPPRRFASSESLQSRVRNTTGPHEPLPILPALPALPEHGGQLLELPPLKGQVLELPVLKQQLQVLPPFRDQWRQQQPLKQQQQQQPSKEQPRKEQPSREQPPGEHRLPQQQQQQQQQPVQPSAKLQVPRPPSQPLKQLNLQPQKSPPGPLKLQVQRSPSQPLRQPHLQAQKSPAGPVKQLALPVSIKQQPSQHVVTIGRASSSRAGASLPLETANGSEDGKYWQPASPLNTAGSASSLSGGMGQDAVSLLLKNPLVWSTGISLLLSSFGLTVVLDPDHPMALDQLRFIEALLGWFAMATAPLTLFTTGLWMYGHHLKQQRQQKQDEQRGWARVTSHSEEQVGGGISWWKLAMYLLARATVAPGFMVIVCWLMGFTGDFAHSLVILALLPVAQTAFVVCKQAEMGTHAVSVVMVASLVLMLPQLMAMLGLLDWLRVFAEDDET